MSSRLRRRGGKKRGSKGRWWDRKYRVWTTLCVASRMLLLHMQEIVFVDSQEGLLSSRGGGGRHTGTRLTTVNVTCGQVWQPVIRICALNLSHPKCTHTTVNTHMHTHTHTNTVNTHPEQWAAVYDVATGSSWGFGALLKVRLLSYLRLEPLTFGLRVRLSNH